MPALVYNFNLEQGVDFERTFRWLDYEGNDKNLNGWRAHMQIREGYGLPVLLNLSTETLNIIINNSFIRLLIRREQTENIIIPIINYKQTPKITLYYDLFLFNLEDQSKKFSKGNIYCTGSVTKEI
jgi:hypothetical protein